MYVLRLILCLYKKIMLLCGKFIYTFVSLFTHLGTLSDYKTTDQNYVALLRGQTISIQLMMASFSGRCQENYCQNGGLCIGHNKCSCTDNYSGRRCERFRLGTRENPASSAQAIIDAGDNRGSGLYWIKVNWFSN